VMHDKQSYIVYREDRGSIVGDAARLSLAVIDYALTTKDRRFFDSQDFVYWLTMAGVAVDDYRVKGLLERVSSMTKRPLTLRERLQRMKDDY
jgi:hypothetical protein